MSACANCGTVLSCGCQRKKASNGASVCRSCITKYENSLKEKPTQTTTEPQLNIWGKDRYKNLQKFTKR
jgi:hypothetical protein